MENSKHGLAQPSGAESAQPQVDPIEIQLKDYPIPVLDEGYCDVSKQGQLPYYLESLPMDTRADIAYRLLLSLDRSLLYQMLPKLKALVLRDFISCLPSELGVHILEFTNCETVLSAAQVCKSWRRVAYDPALWFHFLSVKGWRISHEAVTRKAPELLIANGDVDWRQVYFLRSKIDANWTNNHFQKKVLKEHSEGVYCLQFHENFMATGSRDDSIKLWDIATRKCQQTLLGHSASVLTLQFDDTILVSGGSDASIIVWDRHSGLILHKLKGHEDAVLNVKFDKKTIVSASKDKTIRVWQFKENPGSPECSMVLQGHRAAVNAVVLGANRIVSASGDRLIKVWDRHTGQFLRDLIGHSRGIACVQYNGEVIVSGSSDKTIKIWNADTGECLRTLVGHTDLVRTLQFDQHRIVSGSYDESIKIWNFNTGELIGDIPKAHTNRVYRVQFDDTRIISCSQDHSVVIWNFGVSVPYVDLFQ